MFGEMVEFLDEMRMGALKARCCERALLGNLIARRATVSEPFSHAYVSSLLRAGEALGHGELFELVQDEQTGSCTMMPYDIFSDETGAWEDPCRLQAGFTEGMSGEDLVRRAHARAMIQKSLRKMQDRNNIRGGTSNPGPYSDAPQGTPSPAGAAGTEKAPVGRPPSAGRRRTFSLSDNAAQGGTGAGVATSTLQYNPNHHSSPLFFDSESIENLPYGRHVQGARPRAYSLSRVQVQNADSSRGTKRGRASSTISSNATTAPTPQERPDGGLITSTEQVEWADVAKIFHDVKLSRSAAKRAKIAAHSAPKTSGTIIAPFCRRIDDLNLATDSDDESDEEDEDLSNEAIISRHQIVLDEMKKKLDKFMDARHGPGPRGRKKAPNK